MANTPLTPDVIQDQPFPSDGTLLDNTQAASPTAPLAPQVTPPRTFPQPVIARHTISDSIDTQSRRIKGMFQLDKSGGIQVGQYQNGISGETDITSNGITAINKNNQTTFAIDGDTGDATFMGTIQAGSLIAGDSLVRIDKDPDTGGGREIMNDGTRDFILIGCQKGGF